MATSYMKERWQPRQSPSHIEKLLMKLNYHKYFPQKLSLQDSLKISAGSNNPHLHMMLEQIKMANYKFRKVLYYEKKKISNYNSDSDASDEDEETEEITIHPMDSLLALIYCADNFLRQDIFSKLVSCQVAIPFLLPDPPPSSNIVLPLWAMRSIVKSWKVKTSESTWVPFEERLVDCEVPMVSFMRLSHPGSYSKSRILNNVIDDSKHDFFFNHECEGSSATRKLVDGLVEACWYLPAGEESDVFDNVIMFANFRGNASYDLNSRQLKFLLAHSYVSFVFMLEEDIRSDNNLQSLQSLTCKTFFLLPSCKKLKMEELKVLVPNSAVIELEKQEPAKIVKSIRSRITRRIKEGKSPMFQLSRQNHSFDHFSIFVDEMNCDPCCNGRKHAESIILQIKSISAPFQVKEQMLPLQGSLWHDWATHNKIDVRAHPKDVKEMKLEDFSQKQAKEKLDLRKNQYALAKKPSFVMSKFITILLHSSKEERAYFLQWLKFHLDDRSRVVLSDLQKACKKTRDELNKKELTEEHQEKLRKTLHTQDIQLVNASFGVEHLFRELGQMYESIVEVETDQRERIKVKRFPKIVAELLLSGQPLEIVDGDAGHIPMKWVQAVLNELKESIGNSKLFVLSVLGIQSTGKSTLMNTMFGVRFSVSAGRCTRGAYLQLLKIQGVESKCDYMLIVDTEGLRAPELDSVQTHQHDNELAALIIGLADVTIVNMFGEVTAEISDVLQTAVHAFIRMKKVEMQPSCQFVRHHVSSVSASKTNEGSAKVQETLDKMTKIAAKTEKFEDGQLEKFSDVIKFNFETDIQNFHGLWEGNPPMAPVNPLYCQNADELRSKLLDQAENAGCSLSDFRKRLETLWEAILKEDFIFNFKNTLEVEAFSCLDNEYGKWSWRLQNCYVKWKSDATTVLKSTTLSSFTKVMNEQVKKIGEILISECENIKEAIDLFFKNTNPMIAQTMKQWEIQYLKKIDAQCDDHKRQADQYCNSVFEQRRAKTKYNEMKRDECEKIERKLKQLVSETKVTEGTELPPEVLKTIQEKFEMEWEEWMKEIEQKHPLAEDQDIHARITNCLRNRCCLDACSKILIENEKKVSLAYRGVSLPLKVQIDEDRHIRKASFLRQIFLTNFSPADCKLAQTETQEILKCHKERFAKLDVPYDDHHIISFVQDILQDINNLEARKDVTFTFTYEYRIDLIMEVAGYALKMFNKVERQERKQHPKIYLESLKKMYENKFNALCNATVKEKALASNIVDRVKTGTKLALREKLKGVLPDEIRTSHSLFDSKKSLTGHVLQNLLKQGSFNSYRLYLKDVSRCYFDFIKDYTQAYCDEELNGKRRIVQIAQTHLDAKMKVIKKAAEDARQSQGLEQWLTSFHKDVSATIRLKEDELIQDLVLLEACDITFFTDEFTKELEKCRENLQKSLTDPCNEVLQVIEKVAETLRDSVAGCCEQCPFCKEQCEVLTVGHTSDHHCSMHRPQCIGGYRYSESQEMALENCTVLVASSKTFLSRDTNKQRIPYKQYREIYPNWRIPEEGRDVTPFWKWFIATHKSEIADLYGFKIVSTEHWTIYTKENAEKDLRERYQLD